MQASTNKPVDIEVTIWACRIINDLQGDHIKFFTFEFSKYENNEYIINKTGCEYYEDFRDFQVVNDAINKSKYANYNTKTSNSNKYWYIFVYFIDSFNTKKLFIKNIEDIFIDKIYCFVCNPTTSTYTLIKVLHPFSDKAKELTFG
ncbi:hypothetical protein BCR32DRAFT_283279 [Anaeromyces robustus]|uniref:Uncharacterized protein n=1 Tax=Anaeromyces robustus TaxID=1754192 RepID=A0A1Y1WUY7_9FUNG|nr:hypothetical protein BCR32DRAFT_283279 [Anaeromyces robustus]|eukprot:ORX77323.1 hypothetical protein BCR32DRAFT_283279 [Anaeromyces robustus]